MSTAEVTVQFVNPQKPGKKNASIKTDTGDLYLVPPELFPQFVQGGRYKIEYKSNTFNGATFKFVEKVDVAAPAPVAKYQAGKYRQDDDVVAERIFVCGAMNAMLHNQNTLPFTLTADDLTARVKILREVWSRTFGNPQKDAEMNDEIPF